MVLEVKIAGEGKTCGQATRGGSGRGAAEAGALGSLHRAPAGMVPAPSGQREGHGAGAAGGDYETWDSEEQPMCCEGVTGALGGPGREPLGPRNPLGFLYVVRKRQRAEGAGRAAQLRIYQLPCGLSSLSLLP